MKILNMKRIVFPLFVVVMFGLSSCMKPGDNIQEYQYIPAIVEFSFDLFQNTLKTPLPLGPIVSSQIQNATDLGEGDAIITSFTVNHDQQASAEYTTAYNIGYDKINRAIPEATTGGESMTGDFDLPIEALYIYGWVGYNWFFGFGHKDVTNQDSFVYEMTYDSDMPVVYLRAKKSSAGVAACAFNLYSFFMTHKNVDNIVEFTIQHKIGVDEDGNDEYRLFTDDYGQSVIKISVE